MPRGWTADFAAPPQPSRPPPRKTAALSGLSLAHKLSGSNFFGEFPAPLARRLQPLSFSLSIASPQTLTAEPLFKCVFFAGGCLPPAPPAGPCSVKAQTQAGLTEAIAGGGHRHWPAGRSYCPASVFAVSGLCVLPLLECSNASRTGGAQTFAQTQTYNRVPCLLGPTRYNHFCPPNASEPLLLLAVPIGPAHITSPPSPLARPCQCTRFHMATV